MESLGQMDFLCTECAKSFAMEVDLLIHQTRVPDNRSFSCEICLAISVGNTNHNNHMRAHKSKKKPKTLLICEQCNNETSYKQNLKGTHWKRKMAMSPTACHVLTVENLFLNNIIWQEMCRLTERAMRKTWLSPQVVFFIFSLSYLFLFLHRWCPRACRKGDIEHWFRNVWEKGKRESCQPIPLQQVLWNIWKQLELEQAHEKKACKE